MGTLATYLYSLNMDSLYAECVEGQRLANAAAIPQSEADLILTIYNYRASQGE